MPHPFTDPSSPSRHIYACIIIALLAVALLVSVYSLGHGITGVFPHLFYIPIILAAYLYPQRGVSFAVLAGGLYLSLVYYFEYPLVEAIAAGTARFYVMVLLGAVVSYLADLYSREEQKYRGIFNYSEAGTFLFGLHDHAITETNPRGARMLGTTESKVRGTAFTALWKHPESATAFLHTLQKNRCVENFETELVCSDAAPLRVLLSGACLPGDAVICTAVDITSRKAAEEQVMQSENRYRAIFENTGTATMILQQDRTVVLVNSQFERITGYPREEIEGRVRWTDLAEGWSPGSERGDLVPGQKTCAFRFRHRSGKTCDGSATMLLIPGSEEYVVSFFDVTESKRAEEALRASEEKLRVVFNGTNDAIVVNRIDPSGFPSQFLEVNDTACQRLGIPREEFLRLTPSDLGLLPTLMERTDILESLRAREPVTFEVTFTARNGVRIPSEISSHIVKLQGEDVILSVVRDITERKLTEEVERRAFEQLERNIQQFATLGDHIRNPLGIIMGIADLEQTSASDKIVHQARVINNLVNRLDTGWIESELVKGYLQRQKQKESGNGR